MKQKSRYYTHCDRITDRERERRGRIYRRPVSPTICGLPLDLAGDGLALFAAAVERFGPAYDGGCFCSLIHGNYRWDDCRDRYRCSFFCRADWYLPIFDHGTFFQRRGEPICAVVGQPYDYDEGKYGAALREFCADSGLVMEVSSGWHYPRWTQALIFTRAPGVEPIRRSRRVAI